MEENEAVEMMKKDLTQQLTKVNILHWDPY